MHKIALAVWLLAFSASQALAINCPIGSFPWTDNWGNQICKRFNDGSTSTIQGGMGVNTCPVGSYPWTDSWGNRVCQTFTTPSQPAPQQYYDTSRGCPIGTFQWVDNWGNQVCKRF